MMASQINKGEEVLFEDNRSLEDIIQEIADAEGMTFEQTMDLFKKGLKQANNNQGRKVDHKKKAKAKAKKKVAKASKKRNR